MSPHLVTVAVLDSPEKAALARNVLDEAGIPCYLADANMVGMAWHLSGAVGGIKLQVYGEDEDDARALLDKEALVGPADLAALSPVPDAHDEDYEPVPTPREKNALAALRLTIFALVLPPLALFAYGLLFQVIRSRERLADRYRRQAWAAGSMLLGLPLALVLILLLAMNSSGLDPKALSHPRNLVGLWIGVDEQRRIRYTVLLAKNGDLSYQFDGPTPGAFAGVWGLRESPDELLVRIDSDRIRDRPYPDQKLQRWPIRDSTFATLVLVIDHEPLTLQRQ